MAMGTSESTKRRATVPVASWSSLTHAIQRANPRYASTKPSGNATSPRVPMMLSRASPSGPSAADLRRSEPGEDPEGRRERVAVGEPRGAPEEDHARPGEERVTGDQEAEPGGDRAPGEDQLDPGEHEEE